MGSSTAYSSVSQVAGAARSEPKASSRSAITRVVLEELARVQSPAHRRPLTPGMTLAEAGVGPIRFLDAVNRIEGRYQMRFAEEWLDRIHTCGDLVECIAENMFDNVDRPLLTDFGIAMHRSDRNRVTDGGFALGSATHMAPEQARGERVDARADLYSIGGGGRH